MTSCGVALTKFTKRTMPRLDRRQSYGHAAGPASGAGGAGGVGGVGGAGAIVPGPGPWASYDTAIPLALISPRTQASASLLSLCTLSHDVS